MDAFFTSSGLLALVTLTFLKVRLDPVSPRGSARPRPRRGARPRPARTQRQIAHKMRQEKWGGALSERAVAYPPSLLTGRMWRREKRLHPRSAGLWALRAGECTRRAREARWGGGEPIRARGALVAGGVAGNTMAS